MTEQHGEWSRQKIFSTLDLSFLRILSVDLSSLINIPVRYKVSGCQVHVFLTVLIFSFDLNVVSNVQLLKSTWYVIHVFDNL